MSSLTLTGRLTRAITKLRPSRNYGSPRHLSDEMLKDIGITAADLGIIRNR